MLRLTDFTPEENEIISQALREYAESHYDMDVGLDKDDPAQYLLGMLMTEAATMCVLEKSQAH